MNAITIQSTLLGAATGAMLAATAWMGLTAYSYTTATPTPTQAPAVVQGMVEGQTFNPASSLDISQVVTPEPLPEWVFHYGYNHHPA